MPGSRGWLSACTITPLQALFWSLASAAVSAQILHNTQPATCVRVCNYSCPICYTRLLPRGGRPFLNLTCPALAACLASLCASLALASC